MTNVNITYGVSNNTSPPSSTLTAISMPIPGVPASPPPDPEKHCLLGVWFEIDDRTPFGDAVAAKLPSGASANGLWNVSQATYAALAAQSPGMVSSVCTILKQADKEGRDVVTGIVSANTRRGAATSPRPKRANLDDLQQRCRNLIVQIATLSDDGPLSEGAVKELSKTYAALQAERDEAFAAFAEIDGCLSIGRAIVIESTMEGGA